MKLLLSFCIALSLLKTTLSGPLDSSNNLNYPTKTKEEDDVNLPEEVVADSAELEMMQGEEGRMSEYIKEIQSQVEAPRKNVEDAEVEERKKRSTFRNVGQGRNVAIQPLHQKRVWLGCASQPCVKASCPNLYMEGTDWNDCWGEVFQIYRAAGPGDVRVGDVVGLFMRGQWFSIASGTGQLAPCPGTPTTQYGFAQSDNWYLCWGEVFKIYAKGKSLGDVIQDHDHVTLFYIHGQNWVGLAEGNHPDLDSCPGTTRPPPSQSYDVCWGEIFELWLQ